MGKHKDKIPGGLADKKQPKDFDQDALKAGIKVELEHTSDHQIAQEIAMDHLSEDPNYYKKLKEMEKSVKAKPINPKDPVLNYGKFAPKAQSEKKKAEYAKRIKQMMDSKEDVEKYDRVDREADGKQELDYGSEELDKEKDLKRRWKKLKKALDNESAFYDIADATAEEEQQETPPEGGVEQEDVQAGQAAPEEIQDAKGEGDLPEWLPEGTAVEGEEQSPSGDMPEQGEEGEDIEDLLRQAGHSDVEISHILHGHTVPTSDEVDKAKALAEHAGIQRDQEAHQKEMELMDQQAQVDTEHAKRMKDVEYERAQKEAGLSDVEVEHAKRMKDLEYEKAKAEAEVNEAKLKAEHAKRMLDLEYETAKKQKELELEFKQKEMEMKLKHSEQIAAQRHKDKMAAVKEDAKSRAEEKASDKKKLKKNDEDALEKTVGWKFNPKTKQLSHPEYGFMAVNKLESGNYEIKHNGRSLGEYEPQHIKDAVMHHSTNITSNVIYDPNKPKVDAPPAVKPEASTQLKPVEPPKAQPSATVSETAVPSRYGKIYHPDMSGTVDYTKKKTQGE